MRFSTIAASIAALAVGASAQETILALNASKSGLDVNDLGPTSLVSYANSSIWIGGIKYETYSEPFLIQGAANGGISFTSWHAAPTGWQTAYVYPDETGPIEFTIPHGGYIPTGASSTGFGIDDEGFLTFNGANDLFYGVETDNSAEIESYQIWYAGAGVPEGVNYVGPLYLYEAGFTTIG